MHVVGRDDPVAEFRDAAGQYVSLIEAAPTMKSDLVLFQLASLLPALYRAAVQLPRRSLADTSEDVSSETHADDEVEESHRKWSEIYDRLAVLPIDYYWTVEPDIDGEQEPMVGSLGDDLADIYLALKKGLDGLAAGLAERDVVWQWRFEFWTHWGQHAVDALGVMHRREVVRDLVEL
jgi:Domain of unknown function (DUF5063)